MLTVTSVNVNGLRAAAKKGFVEWLAGTDADVVCLQEVRAEPGQLAAEVRDPEGWHTAHAPAAAKGRAGVSSTPARRRSGPRSASAGSVSPGPRSSTRAVGTSRSTSPV